MYKNKTFLAIIPARGGSKRLSQKNILDLNGKPLIAYSIEAGLKSKYIDKVIVTSDDSTILAIAKEYNSNFIDRPKELALDTSLTFDTILHTIENVETFDYIVLLQATSPLRNSEHIDEAIEKLFNKEGDAIISVCEMEHSPLWSNILPSNDSLKEFISNEITTKRSQDLKQYFRLNGAIYICNREKLLEEKSFFLKDKIFAYKMEQQYSIDIDEEIDFELAKLYMKKEEM